MRRGKGDRRDVVAVDQDQKKRPHEQRDLEGSDAALVEQARDRDDRLVSHWFPPWPIYVRWRGAARDQSNRGSRNMERAVPGGQLLRAQEYRSKYRYHQDKITRGNSLQRRV